MHGSNLCWTQLVNEFNQKHVGKDVKRDLISQTLKDFVKIMQPSDVLKKLRGQRSHVPRARVDPFSMVQVGAYFSHIF